MTLKVNLNASDINQFNFYDQVMIKNKNYRVNKIDYTSQMILSTVEFILNWIMEFTKQDLHIKPKQILQN